MGVSLDGFIADPGGEIDWSVPDEELHRFHNEQSRELSLHLCGRRLWEIMRYWETAEDDPALPEHEREFARIWNALPKVVVSRTLESVDGARLIRDDVPGEVERLKAETDGTIAVGGAALAASLLPLGLIDELRLFVSPVVLGGGTPFFPALPERLALELVETRTFGSRVLYLRYRQAKTGCSR